MTSIFLKIKGFQTLYFLLQGHPLCFMKDLAELVDTLIDL